ncbi:peptide/nickel transport system ATP-binding protein/oligopeptide transport system ATP-binding protein [Paenibacillus taihuensis]|uniref:Peptide/nickel transport system ATP-binding protein/oligopeptide transport system ATP-binding protein n=1 Tax=Paenibacillus taihuensis TaxID=1156355 RepID=A0A3D9R3B2_9BACL|nr:oligopeptide/dipeptide ABC transporter ATP-binding protein [Paenibacillus taihuensis]REE67323.1 peptide/nickel transport system ATP-binding protein/oligopeptide transport system ATP-binding protein [Paenibacillus taihuensis]
MSAIPQPLIELSQIRKVFRTSHGALTAVDSIDLIVERGSTIGLVGESGSGKSTVARMLLRLLTPTSGSIRILGEDVTGWSDKKLKPVRSMLQWVSQHPAAALFPNLTVGQNIMEPMRIHGIGMAQERQRKARGLLAKVGIPQEGFHAFPHELSGGQQQRVVIARALSVDPGCVVLDEAVSSLDVSVQAQILNLLQDLQEEMNLSYLFISHNLAVIRLVCDEVAVMFLGRVVESGKTREVFDHPLHPYTKKLLAAVPSFTPDGGVTQLDESSLLQGDPPSPLNIPSGCAFRSRCPYARERCAQERPLLRRVGTQDVACHFAEEIAAE